MKTTPHQYLLQTDYCTGALSGKDIGYELCMIYICIFKSATKRHRKWPRTRQSPDTRIYSDIMIEINNKGSTSRWNQWISQYLNKCIKILKKLLSTVFYNSNGFSVMLFTGSIWDISPASDWFGLCLNWKHEVIHNCVYYMFCLWRYFVFWN